MQSRGGGRQPASCQFAPENMRVTDAGSGIVASGDSPGQSGGRRGQDIVCELNVSAVVARRKTLRPNGKAWFGIGFLPPTLPQSPRLWRGSQRVPPFPRFGVRARTQAVGRLDGNCMPPCGYTAALTYLAGTVKRVSAVVLGCWTIQVRGEDRAFRASWIRNWSILLPVAVP